MITQELNDRLTRVGPGTPLGNMLRRYWHPVGSLEELMKEPVQPVRLLGESLTLFRSPSPSPLPPGGEGKGEGAKLGLLAERCAHRGLSLAYGIPQTNGLRCAYHGWTYDPQGRCVDMPFEPACLPLKIKAYPVQELGGLIWAYLGPEPIPLLPRWELLVRDDLNRSISMRPLPCNWVQCMDNSMDPVHFEHLHGHYGNYYNKQHSRPQAMNPARHLKIDFDVFEYGVYKRRLVEGEPEDCDDWTTGHPIFFPWTLVQGTGDSFNYQMRVPTDDTNTLHIVYGGRPRKPDEPAQEVVPVRRTQVMWDGWPRVDAPYIVAQDEMAWIGQGPITDRTVEHLATSDKGVILYHNLLLENIAKVERGEDPLGVIRDPEENDPFVQVRREKVGYQAFHIGVRDENYGAGRDLGFEPLRHRE